MPRRRSRPTQKMKHSNKEPVRIDSNSRAKLQSPIGMGGRIMAPDWTFWVLWSIFGVAASGFVPYFLSQKQPHLALWCGFAVFVIGSLAVTLHIRNDLIRKEHPETVFMNSDLSGLLIPDNKPSPLYLSSNQFSRKARPARRRT